MAQSNGADRGTLSSEQQDDLQNPQRMAHEMAQTFQEIAKGEQTASALERQLDGIESRIDQLLAAMEAQSQEAKSTSASPSKNPS